MNILFFDTETTGLPKNYRAPVEDIENWPRMVQIAWAMCDENGDHYQRFDTLIQPVDFDIPEDVSTIHGITNDRAMLEGMPVKDALTMFSIALAKSDLIVGHNISFDRKIVGAEMIRAGFEDSLHGKPRICTMMKSTRHCNLPGKYGPKWPKLEELYKVLFDKEKEGLHDAAVDIQATVECFFELLRIGVITDADITSALNFKPVESF